MNLKSLLVLSSAALLAPLLSRADIERVVEKSFQVSPDQLLKVETDGGNIRVLPGSGNEVHVVAREHFRTDSQEQADDIAKAVQLEIQQSSDGVTATAKIDSSAASGGSWWSHWQRNAFVSFEVTVPSHYRTDLKTSGGNVEIGDLTGKAVAHTSGGNIHLGRIVGEVSAHTSGGNIHVENAVQHLSVSTSGGEISVVRVDGDADLRTSGGNIHLQSVSGAVHAETSGGNVSAGFTAAPKSDCELRTSGGNVDVRIVPNAAFQLDAGTSGGSVHVSDFSILVESGAVGKSHVMGKVNGGGPRILLRTSGGSVHVSAT